MSLRPSRDDSSAPLNKGEDDWETVAADRWRTSFRTLPMSYPTKPDPTTKKWHRPCHRSFLFYNPHRKRAMLFAREESRGDSSEEAVEESPDVTNILKLNADLPGVRAALDSVAVYEDAVGFHYEQFPSLGLNLSNPIDLTVIVDEKELGVHKKRWDEMLEELFDSGDESLESSFVGSVSSGGDLHRSVSTVSSIDFTFSEGSIDSAGMPSTPRPKSSFNNNDVHIKGTSPRSMDFRLQPLSPTRALNATASSFVPASVSLDDDAAAHLQSPPLAPSSAKTKRTPSSDFSFNTFTFPTLNSHTPAALKVRKDDGDAPFTSPSAPANDLLPPFFQDAPQRTRTRKSRTREIVDRLRSQTHPPDTPSSQPTKGPSLGSADDGGDRPSTPPPPAEDDDGWIDASASSLISPSKTKRARELLLALARRRTDSLTSEAVKEIMEAHSTGSPDSSSSQEISFSPSPSPSPPLVTPMDDGWKESDIVQVPPEPSSASKKTKQPSISSHPKDASHPSNANKKKGGSSNAWTARTSSSSSSTHSHSHRTAPTHHPHHHHNHHHAQQHPAYPPQAPHYATPSHPVSTAYPSHTRPMVAPGQLAPAPAPAGVPYFFPQAYPAVAMSVPYGTYLQPHPYPMNPMGPVGVNVGVGVGMGIPMHAVNGGAVAPVPVPVQFAHAPPAAQMVPAVPMQGVPRMGTGAGTGKGGVPLTSPGMGTAAYRQPLKHAAPMWG